MERSYINPGLFLHQTKRKGDGVFTAVKIQKDDVVGIAAGGRIVSTHEIQNLHTALGDFSQQIHEKFHWIPEDKLEIDLLDRMNHSCEPNVGITGDMTFVALRTIEADEELCWDYAMSEFDPAYEFLCCCAAPSCRGKLTGNDWRRNGVLQKYYPRYFTTALREKIAADLEIHHRDIRNGKLYARDTCDEGVENLLEQRSVFFERQTRRHLVEIAEYVNYGIGLRMDGSQQCCRANSSAYRESFVHPVMLGEIQDDLRVAAFGAGDFELAREFIRYKNLQELRIVDWDPEFMEIAKQHLVGIHDNSWQDPRVVVETKYPNAFFFMRRTREMFHHLFVDLTDNSVTELLKPEIGRKLRRLIYLGGKVVIQAGEEPSSNASKRHFLEGLQNIRGDFKRFWIYSKDIPFFRYRQVWIIATDDISFNPMRENPRAIDARIKQKFGRRLETYTGRTHQALFAIPLSLAQAVYDLLGEKFPQYHLL